MRNQVVVGDRIPEHCELIEVHVPGLTQLFNPIDPSPLRERDLEPKTEEFIVSRAQSVGRDVTLGLVVHVDEPDESNEGQIVRTAIFEFFRQRSVSSQRRLKQLFQLGRTSLVIGVVFLGVAILTAELVDRRWGTGNLGALIRESLLIGGWVAMWRPLEIFLYDWWPIRAERMLFDRLSAMPVRIEFSGSSDEASEDRSGSVPAPLSRRDR